MLKGLTLLESCGKLLRFVFFSHLKEKNEKLNNDLIGFSSCSASMWRIHVVWLVIGGP